MFKLTLDRSYQTQAACKYLVETINIPIEFYQQSSINVVLPEKY